MAPTSASPLAHLMQARRWLSLQGRRWQAATRRQSTRDRIIRSAS